MEYGDFGDALNWMRLGRGVLRQGAWIKHDACYRMSDDCKEIGVYSPDGNLLYRPIFTNADLTAKDWYKVYGG